MNEVEAQLSYLRTGRTPKGYYWKYMGEAQGRKYHSLEKQGLLAEIIDNVVCFLFGKPEYKRYHKRHHHRRGRR